MGKKLTLPHIGVWTAVAVMTFAAACAEKSTPSTSHFADYKPFDLETRPDFSGYQEVVGSYLSRNATGADTQACVIGLSQGRRDNEAVWVIWRDGDRLVRWFSGENDLNLSSRNLSLTDDVVPTDADIGSSTYLVSRPWVNELERLCDEHGESVAVVE